MSHPSGIMVKENEEGGMLASTHWLDGIGAFTGLVTASSIVVSAAWAYRKFLRDKPDVTRADLSVDCQLFTHDGKDLLRASVRVSAIGTARLTFVTEPDDQPVVVVYPFTNAMLDDGPPAEWVDLCCLAPVLRDDEFVEARETLEEAVLLSLGTRDADTLAYRVELSINVEDPVLKQQFRWQATDFVPVAILPARVHNVGEET